MHTLTTALIVAGAVAALTGWLILTVRSGSRQPLSDAQRRALAAKVARVDQQPPLAQLASPALADYQRWRDGSTEAATARCRWCRDDDDAEPGLQSWIGKKCTCDTTCAHPACPAPGAAA